MEYFYFKLFDGKYRYFDHTFHCWVDDERSATRFSENDRAVIEKYRLLRGGSFIKVRA